MPPKACIPPKPVGKAGIGGIAPLPKVPAAIEALNGLTAPPPVN